MSKLREERLARLVKRREELRQEILKRYPGYAFPPHDPDYVKTVWLHLMVAASAVPRASPGTGRVQALIEAAGHLVNDPAMQHPLDLVAALTAAQMEREGYPVEFPVNSTLH